MPWCSEVIAQCPAYVICASQEEQVPVQSGLAWIVGLCCGGGTSAGVSWINTQLQCSIRQAMVVHECEALGAFD